MAYMWQKPRGIQKPKANLMDFVHRTTMCKFYQTGRCTKGYSCTFAHSEDQLQSQPDLYKTSLCSKFTRKGFCKNGDQCKYAHGTEELRDPIMNQVPSQEAPLKHWFPQELQMEREPSKQSTQSSQSSQSFEGFALDFSVRIRDWSEAAEAEEYSDAPSPIRKEVKKEKEEKEAEDLEELSSDETCTPSASGSGDADWSPDSLAASLASLASLDWSPQVTEPEQVRIKNTFLEFGCPKDETTLRRSSSVPDLR